MTAPQGTLAQARSARGNQAWWGAAAALAVVLLLLAAITWGPHLARDHLASRVASAIGRDVRIGGIEVRPFRRRIRLLDFAVAQGAASARPLLEIPEATARVDLWAALRGRLPLREVLVRAPTVRFARTAPGKFSFQDILDRIRGNPADSGQPLRFVLEQAEVEDGRLIFQDEVAGTTLQVLHLQVSLAGLSNQPHGSDGPLSGEASFRFEDAPVDLTFGGSPLAEPPSFEAQVEVSQVKLATLAPYLPLGDAARITGRLAGTAELSFGGGGWSLADGNLQLSDATLKAGPQQVAVVRTLAVEGLRLDFARNHAGARALRVDGARLTLIRDEDGRLRFSQSFSFPGDGKGAGAVGGAGSSGAAEAGWQYSLDSADLDQLQVEYIDMKVPAERRLPTVLVDLHAEKLSNDLTESVPIRASMVMGKEARLSLHGRLQPLPFEFRGRVQANAFDIASFEPYFGSLINLSLVSGEVWGQGDLEVVADAQGELAGISYRGELSINDVRALDKVLKTEFVRWSALVAPVVTVEWKPAAIGDSRIEIGDVAFVDFFGRAILDEEGRLNLKHVLEQPEEKAGSGQAAAGVAAEGSPEANDRLSINIRIGTLRIASGHINFTDNYVDPNYKVDLTQLSGSITGLASEQNEPADVSIRGRVNGEAPLEIEGEINLFARQLMLDLRATASGIELTQLSPYAVRWAGYTIKSGTLSAQVHYRIDGRQLEGDNRFVLHQLKLGEKVQSPKPSDLPLSLALSLLRDRQGNVRLNLPISGSLTDPEFSFPGLISRALAGLFRKVVTAPFSFLASITGGSAGEAAAEATEAELNYVRFPAGLATLGPDQRLRLKRLAAALEERPAVGLQVIGYVDRTADREGLRRVRLEAALGPGLRQAERTRETDQQASGAEVSGQGRRERLMALYRDWSGKAVSADGLSTGDLEKLLLNRIDVSEADLLILARDRGVKAVEALVEAGLNGERINLLAPRFASEEAELPASRAHFEIVEREHVERERA